MTDTTIQTRAARLVEREVHACMSSLVATLAQAGPSAIVSTERFERHTEALSDLTEQAMELAAPVPDYEEAQREEFHAGRDYRIVPSEEEPGTFEWRLFLHCEESDREGFFSTEREALIAAMAFRDELPESEVYEHWAVSSWLAEKLEAKGERVDMDFAGLCVWARTTTGQAIYMDGVIEAITAETGHASAV